MPEHRSANVVQLRVEVDRELCQGHNRCVALAPSLFDTDEIGHAFERGEGLVQSGDEELARLAVDSCPERAISLSEVEAGDRS